jgi:hypothetical protein
MFFFFFFFFGLNRQFREEWLEDNDQILRVDDFGEDLTSLLAAARRHEALAADIAAHGDRVTAVFDLAEALVSGGYHGSMDVQVNWAQVKVLFKTLISFPLFPLYVNTGPGGQHSATLDGFATAFVSAAGQARRDAPTLYHF